MAEELISFRTNYYISSFPVEARFYQCIEVGRCILLSYLLQSPQELSEFQDELSRREPLGEWIFVAYYALALSD
ncbi:MAG TPA: hypothetical protein VFA10_09085 [Ktedonobacteraceae bacterium]|nr:hypothetical protein [Ktedonobacteraceae bacterium]